MGIMAKKIEIVLEPDSPAAKGLKKYMESKKNRKGDIVPGLIEKLQIPANPVGKIEWQMQTPSEYTVGILKKVKRSMVLQRNRYSGLDKFTMHECIEIVDRYIKKEQKKIK